MMKYTDNNGNVILIGMPGCGKSTVGILAAKILRLSFVDTDLLLQQASGMRLQEFIDLHGLDAFAELERRTLRSSSLSRTLIATGGSAIYYPDAMEHLRSIGRVVYLRAPLPLIKAHLRDFSDRGIAMKKGTTIESLYAERAPLYERYAHLTVDVGAREIADNMQALVSALSES